MEIRLPGIIYQVLANLEAAGFETWLVGGSVRDWLLGREAKDWDLTTAADLASIQRVLYGSLRLVPVGAKFGTISIIAPELKGEISSFRGESLAADLARRDFTINAMAWHPVRGLRDPHGGQADLAQKLIRCPSDPRNIFAADALRMLRAVRFALSLDFSIEPGTWKAIGELHGRLEEISPERIRDEFSAILTSSRPKQGLDLLIRANLMKHIVPDLLDCVGFEQHNPHHNLDVYQHIAAVVENTPPDLVLRLAALFHDLGKPHCLTVDEKGIGHFYGHEKIGAELAGRALRRLCYDNATIAVVKSLVAAHMLRLNYPRMNPAKLLARVGQKDIDKLFILQEADARGGVDRSLEPIREMRRRVEAALAQNRPYARRHLAVSGRDLIAIGVPPGAQVGEVLDRLLAAVVKNPKLNERERLLQMAGAMLRDSQEGK